MLRRCLLLPFLAAAVLVLPAAAASAQTPAANAAQADGLLTKTLYKTGNSGRYLMGGQWYFRADPTGNGAVSQFAANASNVGWTPVTVPNAWNAKDYSDASFAGGVGWYRKSFHLPSAAKRLSWVVRFESVNYRARIYLNGKLIGKNTGAYLPFEVRLPAGDLKRGGTNVLAVRVDDRRFATDFPPSGLSTTGVPTGGWWNYGGLLREVYLRRIDRVDFNTVQVLPVLPCATCAATIHYRVTLRNYGESAVRVNLTGRFGAKKLKLGKAVVGAKRFATFTKLVRIGNPRLWSPASPYLYNASMQVKSGKKTLQRYTLETGIKSVKVVNGRLLLNGRPMNFRGF